MARIKIKDLPKDRKVSKEELKKIKGGGVEPSPFFSRIAFDPQPEPPGINFTTPVLKY